MPRLKEYHGIGHVEIIGEGNWLGKVRKNYMITQTAVDCCHELTLQTGFNHSHVVEWAIRKLYQELIGPVPKIGLVTRKVDDK